MSGTVFSSFDAARDAGATLRGYPAWRVVPNGPVTFSVELSPGGPLATFPPTIEVGTRIYNRGDMANPDHFGTVTKIENGNVWIESDNTGLELYPEEPRLSYDRPYTYAVPLSMVNFVDAGNGLTRIVTEAAYNARRAAGIAALYGRAG